MDNLLCKPPNHQPHPGEDGWAETYGLNCWGARDGGKSHGAKDLETPASASCGKMSIKDCQAKCDQMEGCDAVTIGSDGSCYRKSNVVPDQCDIAPGMFTTYVKSEWVHAKGFNCWGSRNGGKSHGAMDLEVPADSSAGVMSLDDCQKMCS